jgi:integrase
MTATARKSRAKPCIRPNGYWYCTLTIDGEKHQFGLGVKGQENEPDAWREFNKLQDRLSVNGELETELRSVASVLDYYFRFLSMHHERQAEFAEGLIRRYKTTFGHLDAHELTPSLIEDWLDRPEWSDTTKYQYGSVIRAAFNLAVKRQRLDTSPLRGLKLPKTASRVRWLTLEQEKSVLAVAKTDFRQFIFLCVKTGARPLSEVASVSMSDPDRFCDLEKNIWLFRKHKTDGKSGRNREVVLRPDVLEICRHSSGRFPNGPLFRTKSGHVWTKDGVVKRWGRIRAELKLPEDCTFYSLRHTFATRLLLKGASIHDVAVLLGNSVAMVEKHYGHILDDKDRLQEKLALLD